MELVGVILENASKWAAAEVCVSTQIIDNVAMLLVEDDGRGVTDAEIAQLGKRGTRLDETMAGNGLGLAIALEVVRLNNGSIELSRARSGGLAVRVTLPLAKRDGN
jgi:signal transduction histidine kinase